MAREGILAVAAEGMIKLFIFLLTMWCDFEVRYVGGRVKLDILVWGLLMVSYSFLFLLDLMFRTGSLIRKETVTKLVFFNSAIIQSEGIIHS